jgi:putative transposase
MPSTIRAYKYRLYPSKTQEAALFNTLAVCRNWYNMCLAEKKYGYQLKGRSISRYSQQKTSIQYRKTFPQAKSVSATTLEYVCRDIDKAFQSFFRRVKAGEKPGYPRFKGCNSFNSFGFGGYGNGVKIHGRKLRLFGIGRVSVRWHRPIEGKIKTVRIVHRAGQWFVVFFCEVEPLPELPKTGRDVGIDVGVSSLITTSDGDKVENPKFYREAQTKLRVLQRKLARAKKGSKNRRKALRTVQRQHAHIANQRSDFMHKLSTALVRKFDRIALEQLQVRNMVKNRHLSKSILDSGWSIFKGYLTYKAGSAGREVAFVDPAYTSKCCSNCGAMFEDFDLSVRWVNCGCGLSLDRDHNAAINILKRAGWDAPVQLNEAPLPPLNSGGKGNRAVRPANPHR